MTEAEELESLMKSEAPALAMARIIETAIQVFLKCYVMFGGDIAKLQRIVELKALGDTREMLDAQANLPGPDAVVKKVAPWFVTTGVNYIFGKYMKAKV